MYAARTGGIYNAHTNLAAVYAYCIALNVRTYLGAHSPSLLLSGSRIISDPTASVRLVLLDLIRQQYEYINITSWSSIKTSA